MASSKKASRVSDPDEHPDPDPNPDHEVPASIPRKRKRRSSDEEDQKKLPVSKLLKRGTAAEGRQRLFNQMVVEAGLKRAILDLRREDIQYNRKQKSKASKSKANKKRIARETAEGDEGTEQEFNIYAIPGVLNLPEELRESLVRTVRSIREEAIARTTVENVVRMQEIVSNMEAALATAPVTVRDEDLENELYEAARVATLNVTPQVAENTVKDVVHVITEIDTMDTHQRQKRTQEGVEESKSEEASEENEKRKKQREMQARKAEKRRIQAERSREIAMRQLMMAEDTYEKKKRKADRKRRKSDKTQDPDDMQDAMDAEDEVEIAQEILGEKQDAMEDIESTLRELMEIDVEDPVVDMEFDPHELANYQNATMDEVAVEMEVERDGATDMVGVTEEENRTVPMQTDILAHVSDKIVRMLKDFSKRFREKRAAQKAQEDAEMSAFADMFAEIASTGEGNLAAYKLKIEKILKEWDVLSPARCVYINNRLLMEVDTRFKEMKKLEGEGKPFIDELRFYEYVRDRQIQFLKESREKHPSLLALRPETDDEFMERFQRMLKKHNDLIEKTDLTVPNAEIDRMMMLLEEQYVKELPRFEQLKGKMAKAFENASAYMVQIFKEHGNKDGFHDIKEYELARKIYNQYQDKMSNVYEEVSTMLDLGEDDVKKDWNKMWKLLNTFEALRTEAKPVETWQNISAIIRDQVNTDADRYSRDMQGLFNKELKKIGDLLFQPYEAPKPGSPPESRYFIAYDDYKGLFNQYMALRKFFMKAAANNFDWKRADWKVRDGVANEIETMRRSMSNYNKKLRDPHKIEKELANRQELLSGILADQNKELRRAGRPRTEYQIHEQDILEKIDQSRKNIRAEWTADQLTYKLIFQNFPGSWTEAISSLESEVTELRRRVQTDISAFGPFLSHTISSIWDRFSQKIQNVRPDEREQFMAAIEAEKDFLYKTISNESYRFNGSKLHKAAASGIDSLKDFVMDPTSFTPKDKTMMINDTSIGLYMSNTRRLLGLIDQSMRLRQRMVSEPYRIMGMEGAKEAPKFDMVLTHLFPPSQVELKLRFLMQLPNRKRYEQGPFVKAIKMLFPDFDLETLSNETFIARVAEISQSSQQFLKNVVGMTPIAWSDFENQADELTRLEYEILSQVEDKPIENDPTRQQNDQNFEPTDAPPYDRDAGAVMNDAGLRVNPTFNPVTQGQITRDAVDDAKRVSYIQIVGSLASVFLDPPDSTDPYVPLHVAPAKFFFSKDNYKTLSDQFDSMRPLQPKQTVDDPNGKIEEILSRYGKFLGIRKRATQRTDHPILVQQEAIELTEFVNAFKAYGQQTAGNYVHPVAPDAASGNPNAGAAQASGPSAPTSTSMPETDNNVDPNDAGESTSDPLISGLRAAYQSAPRAPGGGNTENDDGDGGAEDDGLWGTWAPPS